MARPQRPWFRFYVEAVWDRKLRGLPPDQRWTWVAVLALARASHAPGVLMLSEAEPVTVTDIADAAAVPVKAATAALDAFVRLGMITMDPDRAAFRVCAWDERQFESDNITERTRLHRSKGNEWNVPKPFPGTAANVAGNVVGTLPESESETEVLTPPNGSGKGAPTSARRRTG